MVDKWKFKIPKEIELLLKKFNVGLAVLVLILSILWFATDVFEPLDQFVFILLSAIFLSFGIEKIMDGMKLMGALYTFVSLFLFIGIVSSL